LLTAAIIARLKDDNDLSYLIETYLEEPCVFASPYVPEDAQRPYVYLLPALSDLAWDGKNWRGREVRRELIAVTDNTGSYLACEAIAERVRTLLHRYALPLTVDSSGASLQHVFVAQAQGPEHFESDESVCALKVSVRFQFRT
jgi:hypothetical protein